MRVCSGVSVEVVFEYSTMFEVNSVVKGKQLIQSGTQTHTQVTQLSEHTLDLKLLFSVCSNVFKTFKSRDKVISIWFKESSATFEVNNSNRWVIS